jgi:hypothetical protein
MAMKRQPGVKFVHKVEVEARVPEFEALGSLKSLDLAKLSKGTHTIEAGSFRGGCCPKMVRARIKDGIVTGIEVEACKETTKPSKELVALFDTAARKLRIAEPGKWHPVPVKTFLAQAQGLIVIHGHCIQVCVWGHCLTCCYRDGKIGCTTDPIYIGPLTLQG